MTVTPKQIAMARILLDLSQQELADALRIARKTVMRIESGQSPGSSRTLQMIQNFFEMKGIEFQDHEGVRRNPGPLRLLRGHQGFGDFLDDVYETACACGTPENPAEIYLSNVYHQNWINWMGPVKWKKHTDRMTQNKDIMDVRIIVREGDLNFPAKAYSKYKWFPPDLFNEKSFYSYGDKLAFLDFAQDDVGITIMQHKEFARGYRDLFKIAWDHFAKLPEKKP